MTNPAALLKNVLVEAGLGQFGGTSDWSLWIGSQADSVNRCVGIYDSGGLAPNPKWRLDYPSIQFRIRGGVNDYQEAWDKAKELSNYLVGIESRDVGSDRLISVTAIGDVSYIGRDDKNRPEFVFNLRLIIAPAIETTTNREPM